LVASTTGIVPWWTYYSRGIPGVGTALVNVVNLNFLLTANDVDVSDGELNLGFTRVYNSQSGHDASNSDNSTPSVFGNRWTNNLDVHLGWSGNSNSGTVSVYTADGARQDFTCQINVVQACTVQTAGVYDLLATTDLSNGIACQLQWTHKNGVTYMFNAPYTACSSLQQGQLGRLLSITGRNTNFSIQLAYYWDGGAGNPENISTITATHEPDGAQLTLSFGLIPNSNPPMTELTKITRPDGEVIDYKYNSTGGLNGVDKPAQIPVLAVSESIPKQWGDTTPIPAGNLPEVYNIVKAGLLEACGPRATIGLLDNGNPQDGACVDFQYTSNPNQLTAWWTRGVLNPTPNDGFLSPSAIQSGQPTGFVSWNDTAFFSNQSQSGSCPTYAVMSDQWLHQTLWCYDSNNRIFEMQRLVSGSSWLTTAQSWDANNDLTSVTDARGNTTNIAYDPNGNVVEVALPSQTTSQGTLQPTYLLDYDFHNNVLRFCDPANNANNGWNPSQSDNLCRQSGSTYYAQFSYNTSDQAEPYGCLTDTYTPSGYHHALTYGGGGCGIGSPTQIEGAKFSQLDPKQTTKDPKEQFSYNANGLVATITPNNPDQKPWIVSYTNDAMNKVRSLQDPDGVSSYQCTNLDGSVFYSETAYQFNVDGSTGCPTTGSLANGTATPPPYATSYGYDPDSNVATVLNHHNCTVGIQNAKCAANAQPTSNPDTCNGVNVKLGTTCYFYDGEDRPVEVKLPYDSSVDLYTNPWVTRYWYDLTGVNDSFDGSYSISGYGNLFKTQELLPSTCSASFSTPLGQLGSVSNGSYVDVKATSYDALDRPVTKYANPCSTPSIETLTWDSSPLNGNLGGFLGKDCNSGQPVQCQRFDYTPDGEEMTFASDDGASPQRDYTYDPDGRPTQITSDGFSTFPQVYQYNVDGYLASATDASSGNNTKATQATLTYHRYHDNTLSSLDVSSGPLNKTALFTYAYRSDGPVLWEQVDDAGLGVKNQGQTSINYSYSDAGRFTERDENNAVVSKADYYASGLQKDYSFPSGSLSSFLYAVDGEIVSVTPSNQQGLCGTQTTVTYIYTLRGELTGSPPCAYYAGKTYFANGVAPLLQTIGAPTITYSWNDLTATMGSVVGSGNCRFFWCPQYGWGLDTAGRMTTENQLIQRIGYQNPLSVTTARKYDSENHLYNSQYQNADVSSPTAIIHWGPNGHPITIGVLPQGGTEKDETLHWNGDQLLFTTHRNNGQDVLDDIKVDVQGDILPGDTGYSGLTFYDRGPGGLIVGCHNATGSTYTGLGDGWLASQGGCGSGGSGPQMPSSIIWSSTPYPVDTPGAFTLGTGGTLGMPRTDGFVDGFDTIQGVRAYNSNSGSWTSPDSYAGDVFDPSSQKGYAWNGSRREAASAVPGSENGRCWLKKCRASTFLFFMIMAEPS